ncbi:50S ribosomal protein L3 [Nanoarchaeota archaeon]
MPKAHQPRSGSMGVWPRKRAKREYARIRAWANLDKAIPLGFAGYKVGMTHLQITDNRKTSLTKGEDIFCPVTVLECPAIKIAGVKIYKNTTNGLQSVSQILTKIDKELERKISKVKKTTEKKLEELKPEDYDDLNIIVYTQPKLIGLKKKPEIFEIAIGGKKEEKLAYAKENLGKEIPVTGVFEEGEQLDIHAITKGKGFQGPVKRFGIGLRSHKSEKTIRGPGSLGGWKGHAHFMYRVAHAGQMGYHQRTDFNKWLLKIGDDPKSINPKGGFLNYGVVKNSFVLIKGSVPGPRKRLIRFNKAIKPSTKIPGEAATISYTSLSSKQGR